MLNLVFTLFAVFSASNWCSGHGQCQRYGFQKDDFTCCCNTGKIIGVILSVHYMAVLFSTLTRRVRYYSKNSDDNGRRCDIPYNYF